MIKWKILTDEEARGTWDQTLVRFSDCSPFQSYAWGEYRRSLGWQPCRWAAFDDQDQIVAMMQASLRRYPLGVGLVWCEGGPVGDLSSCDERLQSAIMDTTNVKRLYCRFRCDRERNIKDCLQLTAQGWSMPWSPITTNYSMILDLSQSEEHLLAACDRNWRRNLRRSQECDLKVSHWHDASADEVLAVYQSMQDLKGLEEQFSHDEIEQLLKHLNQRLVLYRCDDEDGHVVSLLGCLIIGHRAGAVFWATSEMGRKLHASYAIFWALVQHCRRLGLKSYDLAGIDPVRNHGVYRFKRDTGAVPVEYLGEWDWANSSRWRWFGNWAIARRNQLDMAKPIRGESPLASQIPSRFIATTVRASLSLFALITSHSID